MVLPTIYTGMAMLVYQPKKLLLFITEKPEKVNHDHDFVALLGLKDRLS
jgi:hypothetical protein